MPESLRDIDVPTPANGALAPRVKTFDEGLRSRLDEYRKAQDLSLAELGRQLGCSDATVSRYLAKKPEGDVQRMEAVIADTLKGAAIRERRAQDNAYFETSVARQFAKVCQTIQKTNDVGLIHGPAGIGKTRAAAAFHTAHPSTVLVTVARWHAPRKHFSRDLGGLETLIFDAIESSKWDGRTRRAKFMVERLKGSNRLLILDNAHRLAAAGLQWLFDFHDETGCPMALVGNPEVLITIRRNDQMFSRIGLKREMTLKGPEDAAMEMLRQYAPEHADELSGLAATVVKNRGHLRALKKHLLLLGEFLAPAKGDATVAFRAAHEQLVNADYTL